MPCVSVGFPVFNGEKYLEPALDSIITQTFTDFELIISDNASTDRTQAICMEYAARDPRIRYYRNDRNLGAAPNFNKVVKLSSGKYFKWAAYDDLIAPDFLMRCVEVMDQHPEVVLCFPRVKIIDQNGAYQENYIPEPETVGVEVQKRFRNLLLYPHLSTQFYGLIRSSVLKKTSLLGNFPSSDEVFLIELGFQGDFYEVPDYLFLLRKHSEQSTEGSYQVQRARTVWFDTSWKGKIVLPKWIYFFTSMRAIRSSRLNTIKRVYCYRQMLKWVIVPSHFRAMGKDGLIAANQFIRSIGRPVV
ncbi:MAG: glycosyltransferase family 2 protein [Omnitrophica WOR_2 bacterium]